MVITRAMLADSPSLVRKIDKFAASENLAFSEACIFLLKRWFHLNSFCPGGGFTHARGRRATSTAMEKDGEAVRGKTRRRAK